MSVSVAPQQPAQEAQTAEEPEKQAFMGGPFAKIGLAIVLGFYVISAVTPTLHTPLMSETNAISGIVLVGAILQINSPNIIVTVLAFLAIVVSSVNVFGGFAITDRMLGMFVKEDA